MTDRIVITGLRVRGFHGVLDSERRDGQDFVIDASLELSLAPAGSSDGLEDTVDYAAVADRITAIVAGEPVNLIETLAERIAATCLMERRVDSVVVTVHKPQAPVTGDFQDIAVSIERRVEDSR